MLEIQSDHQIPARKLNQVLIKKKQITWYWMGFAIPVDHWVKVKENEKINNYLNFARELKKTKKIKVSELPFIVGSFEMVSKCLEKILREMEKTRSIDTIQTVKISKKSKMVSWGSNGQSAGLHNRRTLARTSVTLLHSLSDQYPLDRYEQPYPSSYGLNSTTIVLLEGWLRH